MLLVFVNLVLLSFMLGLSGLIVVSRASTSLLPTMNPLCAHHHSGICLCCLSLVNRALMKAFDWLKIVTSSH